MWRIWTVVLALLLVTGVASAANRPSCSDPQDWVKGVCFIEINGALNAVGYGDPDGNKLLASWEPRNDWGRIGMNHFENSRFRFAANNAELLYCPPSVTLADHCYDGADPKPELWWHGTGNVELLGPLSPPSRGAL